MRFFILIISFILISCNSNSEKKEIESKNISKNLKQELPNIYVVKTIFFSKDSLPISADIYEVDNKKPTVLLCHQAGYSRGEYNETAMKLCNYGFSSIAIDQRSGGEVNGVINKTTLAAKNRNLATNYLDAKSDIEAAINYMYEMNGGKPIILVGSSYSATLALIIGNNSEKVKAIVAFSPGEYFETIDVKNTIKNISKPVFVTSSKKESVALKELVSLINVNYVTHYTPDELGVHGSKALWKSTEGNEGYWNSLLKFLLKQ
jgi:predicted alpha/beta hydrolase